MARSFCWILFALVFLSVPALADGPLVPATFAPERLGSGGYVVFFRHTQWDKTPSQSVLWEMDRASSCESGGALNVQGEGESRGIRQAIERLAIPTGELFVSPTCRTKQMARIIFSTAQAQDNFTIAAALAPPWVKPPSQKDQDTAALNAFLSEALPPGENRFLISHSQVLTAESIGQDIALEQGEAAVFRPVKKNSWPGFEFLGIIHLKDLGNKKKKGYVWEKSCLTSCPLYLFPCCYRPSGPRPRNFRRR